MALTGHDPMRARGLLAASAAAAVIICAMWLFARHSPPSAPSGVVVISAPAKLKNVTGSRLSASATSEADPVSVSPVAVVEHLRQRYGVLSDATMACSDQRCTLTATIRPPTSQQDLDVRQAMLLGGLAATLAADGYAMRMPFDMEEVDDNLFHLRADVNRIRT